MTQSHQPERPVAVTLEPCPFCGGAAEYRWHSSPECWVECKECGAVGPSAGTTEENAVAWNTRLSALTRSEEDGNDCERCQGNGEIVTDWERYKHPHEDDKGDEAVAECPDCYGTGKVSKEAAGEPVAQQVLASAITEMQTERAPSAAGSGCLLTAISEGWGEGDTSSRFQVEREEMAIVAALQALLPYAEREAAKAPTTDSRVKRMLQARKDRDFARSILALFANTPAQAGEGK